LLCTSYQVTLWCFCRLLVECFTKYCVVREAIRHFRALKNFDGGTKVLHNEGNYGDPLSLYLRALCREGMLILVIYFCFSVLSFLELLSLMLKNLMSLLLKNSIFHLIFCTKCYQILGMHSIGSKIRSAERIIFRVFLSSWRVIPSYRRFASTRYDHFLEKLFSYILLLLWWDNNLHY
jgi:hypothetical protein